MTATICIAAWFVLAAGYLYGNHRWNQRRAREAAEVVNWLPLLPPVPPPVTPPYSQTVPDASWFDGMPVEVLSDDAIRPLFDSLISTAWEWPDTAEDAA